MADSGRSREIRNAATGETVRFIRTAEETGGELLVMEAHWTDPDHVTPAHIHPGDGGALARARGRGRVPDRRVTRSVAGPGDTVIAAPGELHDELERRRGPGADADRDAPAPALGGVRPPALRPRERGPGGRGSAQRSIIELLTEFTTEIEIPASE